MTGDARPPYRPVAGSDGADGPLVPVLRLVHEDGRASAASAAWCRTSGLSLEGSLGLGWLDAVDRADRPPLLDAVRRTHDGTVQVAVLFAGLAGRRTRWRLSADELGVLAVTAVPPADSRLDGRSGVEARLLGEVLSGVFAVTMDLTSCARLAEEPLRSRIASAVEDLDRIVFDAHRR